MTMASSEMQLQSELNLPGRVGRIACRPDFAEVRTGEIARVGDRHHSIASEVWVVKVRMVKDFEELSPELQIETFAEMDILEGREIHVLEWFSGNLRRGTT